MRISIIPVVRNRQETILNAIQSVQQQDYVDIEHIFIDGKSTDQTLSIIKEHVNGNIKILSEGDQGIYDALNKGISMATGDIIGILHSDDLYAKPDTLSKVMGQFQDETVDAVYGDALFFAGRDPGNVMRKFTSAGFNVGMLPFGVLPAHTTLFVRKKVFDKFGLYNVDFKISGDAEFMARIFLAPCFKSRYLKEVLVLMAIGGLSSSGVKNSIILNLELLRGLRQNGIKTNLFKILLRYRNKIKEFILRD